MSAAATHVEQPATFAFTPDNLKRAQKIIAKYPQGREQSAVLPLLDMAQRQAGNWVPRAAMDYIAGLLGIAPIRVYEVATFYTMFNLAPVGKYLVQICTTTPCWLRGSDDVSATTRRKVEETAKRLGYVPNRIAGALASNRVNLVAVIPSALWVVTASLVTARGRGADEAAVDGTAVPTRA